jgi:putative NADH-flavin reductase
MPHLAIFGGTGPSGQCLIEEALSRNHTLALLVRSPSKLPQSITSNPSVTITQGSLSDRDAITKTIHGADAVLSTLGPSLSVSTAVHGLTDHSTPIADGYKVILDVMQQEGVKRLIALGTVSNQNPEDGTSLVKWCMVSAVWIFLHSAWRDVVQLGKSIQESSAEWTIARVARLTSGEGGHVKAGLVGKEGTGVFLARRDLARWFLGELERGEWIRKMPVVYST